MHPDLILLFTLINTLPPRNQWVHTTSFCLLKAYRMWCACLNKDEILANKGFEKDLYPRNVHTTLEGIKMMTRISFPIHLENRTYV